MALKAAYKAAGMINKALAITLFTPHYVLLKTPVKFRISCVDFSNSAIKNLNQKVSETVFSRLRTTYNFL